MAYCESCVHYALCEANGKTVDFPVDDGVCLFFATAEAFRPVGEWGNIETIGGLKCVRCSECGFREYDRVKYSRLKYCPGCGARMKGE